MPPLLDSHDYERQIQPSPNIIRGGIKLFGLETRLASDDFVLPAWIAFLFHLFYLIATSGNISKESKKNKNQILTFLVLPSGIMAYSMQILKTGPSCINSYYLDIYMILAVSFLIIISILDITLALNRYYTYRGFIRGKFLMISFFTVLEVSFGMMTRILENGLVLSFTVPLFLAYLKFY